jgi:hypothetical protein
MLKYQIATKVSLTYLCFGAPQMTFVTMNILNYILGLFVIKYIIKGTLPLFSFSVLKMSKCQNVKMTQKFLLLTVVLEHLK